MVKAEVRYTLEHFQALFDNSRNIKFANTLVYILIAINLVFAVRQIYMSNGDSIPWVNIIMAMLFICYNLYIKFFPAKRALKKHCKRFPNTVISFEFSEDSVSFETRGNDYAESCSYSYEKLLYAQETKDFFLLYFNINAACIIGKREIIQGLGRRVQQPFE